MSDADILEEILADAYAGIDVFAGHTYEGATRFSESVRGTVETAQQQSWSESDKDTSSAASRHLPLKGKDLQRSEKNTAVREDSGVKFSREPSEFDNVTPATIEESKNMDATDKRNVARLINEANSVIDGKMSSGQLVLIGKPSDILAKYMNPDAMLYMPQKAVKKAVLSKEDGGKHGLGYGVIYDLPFQFADPLIITGNTSEHSQKGDNSIVVWTDYMTEAGDSVIVPISIGVNGDVGLYNSANTVFDAYDTKYVKDLLRDGNILYTKNNRNINELLSQRREVPKVNRSDVPTDDSIGNSERNVKQKFSREVDAEYMALAKNPTENGAKLQKMVDEAAKAAMPNTKIVDEDGNPMRVYHGSDAEPTKLPAATSKNDAQITQAIGSASDKSLCDSIQKRQAKVFPAEGVQYQRHGGHCGAAEKDKAEALPKNQAGAALEGRAYDHRGAPDGRALLPLCPSGTSPHKGRQGHPA